MAKSLELASRGVRFALGQVVVTPAANDALELSGLLLADLFARHQAGDWGDVNPQSRAVNEQALLDELSVQSMFTLADGERIVIVTNGPRTLTTVHLDTP